MFVLCIFELRSIVLSPLRSKQHFWAVHNETITLKEVFKIMDAGTHFSIAFVTSDDERDTGGEWIEITDAYKGEFVTKAEQVRLNKAQPKQKVYRNPNHFENSTRNIILPNGENRKINIQLIRRFDKPGVKNLHRNGKVVM